MRIRFRDFYTEITTNKAMIEKMLRTAGDKINLMSQDLREMASDYIEMVGKFKEKVVEGTVYNGGMLTDWFSGKYGNKCQGIIALRELGRRVIRGMNEAVGANIKKI